MFGIEIMLLGFFLIEIKYWCLSLIVFNFCRVIWSDLWVCFNLDCSIFVLFEFCWLRVFNLLRLVLRFCLIFVSLFIVVMSWFWVVCFECWSLFFKFLNWCVWSLFSCFFNLMVICCVIVIVCFGFFVWRLSWIILVCLNLVLLGVEMFVLLRKVLMFWEEG